MKLPGHIHITLCKFRVSLTCRDSRTLPLNSEGSAHIKNGIVRRLMAVIFLIIDYFPQTACFVGSGGDELLLHKSKP